MVGCPVHLTAVHGKATWIIIILINGQAAAEMGCGGKSWTIAAILLFAIQGLVTAGILGLLVVLGLFVIIALIII